MPHDVLGYLSLHLHAHLPFVRHPEHPEFLEEDWLYEAITETYVPLVEMMDGLLRDGVQFGAMLPHRLVQCRREMLGPQGCEGWQFVRRGPALQQRIGVGRCHGLHLPALMAFSSSSL